MAIVTEKSSTGLDANLAAMLCYAVGWVTGLIFFVIEKDSRFVKFHAMQSLVVWIAVSVLWYFVLMIPIIGLFLSPFMFLAIVILWILLMVKAYNGEKFKMPLAGDFAEQQAAK